MQIRCMLSHLLTNNKLHLENDEYLYEYQAELFQTLHEYSYL